MKHVSRQMRRRSNLTTVKPSNDFKFYELFVIKLFPIRIEVECQVNVTATCFLKFQKLLNDLTNSIIPKKKHYNDRHRHQILKTSCRFYFLSFFLHVLFVWNMGILIDKAKNKAMVPACLLLSGHQNSCIQFPIFIFACVILSTYVVEQ